MTLDKFPYRFALLLLILSGCAQPAESTKPKTATVYQASHASILHAANSYAEVCDSIADKIESGEIKSNAEAYDLLHKLTTPVLDESLTITEQAMDAAAPPKGKFSQSKTLKVFRDAAKGFRRAGK